MSDIGKVREILQTIRRTDDVKVLHRGIDVALPLLDREAPQFKAKPDAIGTLTEEEKQRCKALRAKGWSLKRIANEMRTTIGRVSEAINDKR